MSHLYSRTADASAITLSSLCLFHCLALPLLATVLPVAGVFAEAEWLHKALVLMALPVSGFVILRSKDQQYAAGFTVLAIAGLAPLVAAAFVEPLHDYETPLTVIGALMLASAHILRWKRHTH